MKGSCFEMWMDVAQVTNVSRAGRQSRRFSLQMRASFHVWTNVENESLVCRIVKCVIVWHKWQRVYYIFILCLWVWWTSCCKKVKHAVCELLLHFCKILAIFWADWHKFCRFLWLETSFDILKDRLFSWLEAPFRRAGMRKVREVASIKNSLGTSLKI